MKTKSPIPKPTILATALMAATASTVLGDTVTNYWAGTDYTSGSSFFTAKFWKDKDGTALTEETITTNAYYYVDADVNLVVRSKADSDIKGILIADGKTVTIATRNTSTTIESLYLYEVAGVGESGTGVLELQNGAYLTHYTDADLVITNVTLKVSPGTGKNASQLAASDNGTARNIKVYANIIGEGTLNLTRKSGTKVDEIQFYGDNSEFTGVVNTYCNNIKTVFGTANSGFAKAAAFNTLSFDNDSYAGRIMATFTGSGDNAAGTLSFNSFTNSHYRDNKSYMRFNNNINSVAYKNRTILQLGGGRLSMKCGDDPSSNTRSAITLQKTGDDELEVWNPKHVYGTEINGGTLKVTHPDALSGANAGSTAPKYTISSTSNNYITFGGGTLKYGTLASDTYTNGVATSEKIEVTTDWSALITNSTSAISIDTDGKDVTWATALHSSNTGGLIKKGEGSLDLSSVYSAYTGDTIVSNGTLKVAFSYAGNSGFSRKFTKESDASLEVTLYNSAETRASLDIPALFPSGVTLCLTNNKVKGMERLGNLTNFIGTINFWNNTSTSNSAGGFVNSNLTELGGTNVNWGILGEPSSAHTRVFDIEAKSSGSPVAYFGALRQTSTNAMIYIKNKCALEIGALGKESIINGQFETGQNFDMTSKAGSLTLGKEFAVVGASAAAYTGTATITIQGGAFTNRADLSNIELVVYEGTTNVNFGTFGKVTYKKTDGTTLAVREKEATQMTNVSGEGRAKEFAEILMTLDNDLQEKSYFTNTVTKVSGESQGSYVYSYAMDLDPTVVRPTLDTEDDTPFTVTSTTATFAVDNVKKGLWYSVVSSDSATGTYSLNDDDAKEKATSDGQEISVSATLNSNDTVKFFRVGVDYTEPTTSSDD